MLYIMLYMLYMLYWLTINKLFGYKFKKLMANLRYCQKIDLTKINFAFYVAKDFFL